MRPAEIHVQVSASLCQSESVCPRRCSAQPTAALSHRVLGMLLAAALLAILAVFVVMFIAPGILSFCRRSGFICKTRTPISKYLCWTCTCLELHSCARDHENRLSPLPALAVLPPWRCRCPTGPSCSAGLRHHVLAGVGLRGRAEAEPAEHAGRGGCDGGSADNGRDGGTVRGMARGDALLLEKKPHHVGMALQHHRFGLPPEENGIPNQTRSLNWRPTAARDSSLAAQPHATNNCNYCVFIDMDR